MIIGNKLKTLAEENLIEEGRLKQWVDTHWHTMHDCIHNNNPDIVNTSVQAILRTRTFFDDLNALAFVLYPVKTAILTLESQDCSLADCFIGLVCLGMAIKRLPENDYHNFRQQAIAIYNRRFAEFDDDAYILCFFLHPEYSGKQSYRYRAAPFNVPFDNNESPTMWWISLEDNFLKNEDHICQLANKLFSITPHAARCERIWSTLG
ncbi:37284_t:CDS:2 [Gigaspora margarita]|uniref:37284_t:CDS:1 n=1 Tax=Gigaspora margarita TaxID=4874 RepID=A0ABN7WI81_GIGMA|nr:37284_t:CDS:2 [Gigaspora margarita]